MRRLESNRLKALYEMRGFGLVQANFSCQHAGAINWITRSGSDFVRDLADPARAVDAAAARRLAKLRRSLLRIAYLRSLATRVDKRLRWGRWSIRAICWLIAIFSLYLIGKRVDRYWEERDAREWSTRRSDPNGSEMYLYFQR